MVAHVHAALALAALLVVLRNGAGSELAHVQDNTLAFENLVRNTNTLKPFAAGDQVTIQGFEKRPELNGLFGTLTDVDEKGWIVKFENGRRKVVPLENLVRKLSLIHI